MTKFSFRPIRPTKNNRSELALMQVEIAVKYVQIFVVAPPVSNTANKRPNFPF